MCNIEAASVLVPVWAESNLTCNTFSLVWESAAQLHLDHLFHLSMFWYLCLHALQTRLPVYMYFM